MKIGLSPLQGQADFEETVKECERAEAAGFDSVWIGEHHNNPVLYPAPLISLAAIASRTHRIQLGTGVLLLPLYHPLMVAEEGAMVDMISGGRLILGVGAGYAPEEFAAFGSSLKERGSRLEKGEDEVALIRYVFVATSTKEAVATAGESFIQAFERMYFRWPHPVVKRPSGELTIERLAEDRIILGDPKTCAEEIIRFS